MDTSDIGTARRQATAFARAHLHTLAQEVLKWQNTGLLPDGKLSELDKLCLPMGELDSLKIAEDFVQTAALELVASLPVAVVQPAGTVSTQAGEESGQHADALVHGQDVCEVSYTPWSPSPGHYPSEPSTDTQSSCPQASCTYG